MLRRYAGEEEQGGAREGGDWWAPKPSVAPNYRAASALMVQGASALTEELKRQDIKTVVGPLATLLACERADVGVRISNYLSGNMNTW